MKKLFTNRIVLAAITLMSVFSLSAKTVYVATDGNNSNDGLTWDNAVSDLTTAYSKAVAGDQIWMAGGTYAFTATINMIDAVDIYGGFAKGATSIDARERPDAKNEPWKFTSETVLTITMPASYRPFDRVDKDTPWQGAVLDGLAIKDIETTNARVMYLSDGVTLQNSSVINCSSTNTHVYFERNGVVRNCLFESNYKQSGSNGVAVQLRGSKENEKGNLVENCIFRNNSCGSISIYNTGTGGENKDKHIVRNSKFIGNTDLCISMNEQAERPIEITGCLFEENVAASAAATSPQGIIITGGAAGDCTIANCIIRNNRNTVGADGDWKNCIVSLTSGTTKIMNSLIANNSSPKQTMYVTGSVFNSTIVNNEGCIYGTLFATFMNNAMIGNVGTDGKKVFDMDTEASCYLVNNAINSTSDIATGGPGVEIYGTIEADATNFVSPTSFTGVATTTEQKSELQNANFSLTETSSLIGAGDTEELEVFVGDAYATIFQKDLAGSNRFAEDGKINIGAYQKGNVTDVPVVNKNVSAIYGTTGAVVIETLDSAQVEVYTVAGVLVKRQVVSAGVNHIAVENRGLYLVRSGNSAYKVFVQ